MIEKRHNIFRKGDNHAMATNETPRKIKKNMPDSIPIMVLGRLAFKQFF